MNTPNPSSLARFQRVVGQLRELLGKATPAPWAIANWGYADDPHMVIEGPEIPKPATRDGFWFGGQKAVDWGDDWNADNAALIVAAVNALPALLAIADAAAVVSAQRNGPYLMADMDATLKAESDLRTALSLLPNTVMSRHEQHEQVDSRHLGGQQGRP